MPKQESSTTFNPWPLGILLTFAIFISGSVFLIVIACSNRSELVAQDYYDQEIRFQERLDELKRTEAWNADVAATWDPRRRAVEVSLPRPHVALGATGTAKFYRPSDASCDDAMPLQPDATGTQVLSPPDLRPGLWKVQLAWNADGERYFAERSFIVTDVVHHP